MRLTSKAVAALALPSGKADMIIFDSELPGFGYRLRLGANGTMLRSWVVQYKRKRESKRITLGSAQVLGAEAARAAAKKELAKVALGEDPAAIKHARRAADALTMRAQVGEYLAIKQSKLAARTLSEVTRYLRDPGYFGMLHRLPLDRITLRDVAARIVVIERERGSATAAKARSALAAFCAWCMKAGLLTANPCLGSDIPKTQARDRVLSDAELLAIWLACEQLGEYGRVVRLLTLLAARRAEVGGLAWSELDLDGPTPTWVLPRARAKNRRQHIWPLCPMALAIIASVPRMVGRDCLFGAHAAQGFSSWGKGKAALDKRCGVRDWAIHDIRRSVATHMAEQLAVQPHIVEQVLGHETFRAGVRGVYNRATYQREVRDALLRWEAHIAELISGERKVIPFGSERIK